MADFELALSMMTLARTKATGLLEVQKGEKRHRIEWAAGHPVFAIENTHGETLGRLLVRQGLLTASQYEAAIERMTARASSEREALFGDTVVEDRLPRFQASSAGAPQSAPLEDRPLPAARGTRLEVEAVLGRSGCRLLPLRRGAAHLARDAVDGPGQARPVPRGPRGALAAADHQRGRREVNPPSRRG